jgi:hypothetical protein
MLDPKSHSQLQEEISSRIRADKNQLDQLCNEVRPLRNSVKRIFNRGTTAISLVGTDGGNNQFIFDPFLVHLIRVVDSSNNEYCLQAITPTTSVSKLSSMQFNKDGTPKTALGYLMEYVGVSDLTKLSHMIRSNDDDRPTSPSWVQFYRELMEWAILFSIIRTKDFGTDTIIVFNGLLRSKVFALDYFKKYLQGLAEGINNQQKKNHRKIYLAGVAKHSKVLSKYRLAMSLERILITNYPSYVEIPKELEEKTYIWSEYARGDDLEIKGGEINKFVGGKMFFVKFGNNPRDPIWPVDIFLPQLKESQTIMGCLLADAVNGFPVPFYPQCLQKAHENASLVGFDFNIIQDEIFEGIRKILAGEEQALDIFGLQDADPAQRRY